MFDVDENPDATANINFIDRMTVSASLGGVDVPVVITGSSSNVVNAAGDVITGIAAAGSTTSDGNMWVTISSPVDTVVIEYDNDPAVNADPGQQGVGLHTIEFCPQAADLVMAISTRSQMTGRAMIMTQLILRSLRLRLILHLLRRLRFTTPAMLASMPFPEMT